MSRYCVAWVANTAFTLHIQIGWSPAPHNHVFCNGVSASLRASSPSSSVCVCLHACCAHHSVISHTDSPLVAGDWFNIPPGNLCRTNSLQEWKGFGGGKQRGKRGRGGGGEKWRKEEICGEIIISSVTVATFWEADVNKISSYTIHFNFTSKKMQQRVGAPRVLQNTHSFLSNTQRGGGWRRVLLTDWLGSTSVPVVI